MDNKTLLEKVKSLLIKEPVDFEFASVVIDDENTLYYEILEVGASVYSDEDMTIPFIDGEYTIDGQIVKVVDGLIDSIVPVDDEVVVEDEPVVEDAAATLLSTVQAIDKWNIEVVNESFIEGEIVEVRNEDGTRNILPDGEYFLLDGRSIQVNSDGKIVKISSPDEFRLTQEVNELKETIEVLEAEKLAFKTNVEKLTGELEDIKAEPIVEPISNKSQETIELTLTEKRLNALSKLKELRK